MTELQRYRALCRAIFEETAPCQALMADDWLGRNVYERERRLFGAEEDARADMRAALNGVRGDTFSYDSCALRVAS